MRLRRDTQSLLSLFIFVYSIDPDERVNEENVEVGSRPNDRRRPHETQ